MFAAADILGRDYQPVDDAVFLNSTPSHYFLNDPHGSLSPRGMLDSWGTARRNLRDLSQT